LSQWTRSGKGDRPAILQIGNAKGTEKREKAGGGMWWPETGKAIGLANLCVVMLVVALFHPSRLFLEDFGLSLCMLAGVLTCGEMALVDAWKMKRDRYGLYVDSYRFWKRGALLFLAVAVVLGIVIPLCHGQERKADTDAALQRQHDREAESAQMNTPDMIAARQMIQNMNEQRAAVAGRSRPATSPSAATSPAN
jgi:hypothetical protein